MFLTEKESELISDMAYQVDEQYSEFTCIFVVKPLGRFFKQFMEYIQ